MLTPPPPPKKKKKKKKEQPPPKIKNGSHIFWGYGVGFQPLPQRPRSPKASVGKHRELSLGLWGRPKKSLQNGHGQIYARTNGRRSFVIRSFFFLRSFFFHFLVLH